MGWDGMGRNQMLEWGGGWSGVYLDGVGKDGVGRKDEWGGREWGWSGLVWFDLLGHGERGG